ncbi:MAG: hypothetical protein J7J96_05530 [Sulfurimonas sp.]|nr:hypothetical protein [Sulfurimonas sp.]
MISDKLYKIKDYNDIYAKVELSGEEHPIFKAHFPSNPILPGFMHLEIISEVFNIEITQIKKAKFIEIVRPNQLLKYKKENNKFSVFVGEKKVATFSL